MPTKQATWASANLNDHVRVKLTQIGLDAYAKDRAERNAKMPWAKPFPLKPNLDDEGYYHTQLWELMREFGPLLYLGGNPPFETEILIRRG